MRPFFIYYSVCTVPDETDESSYTYTATPSTRANGQQFRRESSNRNATVVSLISSGRPRFTVFYIEASLLIGITVLVFSVLC